MLTIGIYLFDKAELLDFAGPLEVFTTANRLHQQSAGTAAYRVMTLSDQGQDIRCRAGLRVTPDLSLSQCPQLDLCILPGGEIEQARNNQNLKQWLLNQRQHAKTLASICNGAFILAEAGMLTDLSVTTHWEDAPQLQREFTTLSVQANKRFIDHGHTLTTAGVAAGIDACLHWVARHTDTELAKRTARQMDYPWSDTA